MTIYNIYIVVLGLILSVPYIIAKDYKALKVVWITVSAYLFLFNYLMCWLGG